MVLLDVNVLLYAHHEEISDHPADRAWLEELIHSPQAYGPVKSRRRSRSHRGGS